MREERERWIELLLLRLLQSGRLRGFAEDPQSAATAEGLITAIGEACLSHSFAEDRGTLTTSASLALNPVGTISRRSLA